MIDCGGREAEWGPVFARFRAETGGSIEPHFGASPELAERWLRAGEGNASDLILAEEAGWLGALSDQNLLEALPASILEAVEPQFHGALGRWVGISGRARLLVVSPELPAEALPQTLEDLATPTWNGKLGWAPASLDFEAHVSVLRNVWGEAKTQAWLKGLRENGARSYPDDRAQVEAVARGEIQLGWVSHPSVFAPDAAPVRAVCVPTAGDLGNVLIVSGVGLRAHGPRRAAALAFVTWLTSEPTQAWLAQAIREYPVRRGVAAPPELTPLTGTAEIEARQLVDLQPTRALLEQLGLR
ncbi:MAG: extracellular solute-binding protein [Planctomycetes bacterium]|nr:extracellular solute-binding protein [Planctomycetota bacterium]